MAEELIANVPPNLYKKLQSYMTFLKKVEVFDEKKNKKIVLEQLNILPEFKFRFRFNNILNETITTNKILNKTFKIVKLLKDLLDKNNSILNFFDYDKVNNLFQKLKIIR